MRHENWLTTAYGPKHKPQNKNMQQQQRARKWLGSFTSKGILPKPIYWPLFVSGKMTTQPTQNKKRTLYWSEWDSILAFQEKATEVIPYTLHYLDIRENCFYPYLYFSGMFILMSKTDDTKYIPYNSKNGLLQFINWLWIWHVNEYPTMPYIGNPRHTQSMIAYIWLSIFGNSSERLHCGNVVNMPY